MLHSGQTTIHLWHASRSVAVAAGVLARSFLGQSQCIKGPHPWWYGLIHPAELQGTYTWPCCSLKQHLAMQQIGLPGCSSPSQCPEYSDFCSCCYALQAFSLVPSSLGDFMSWSVCASASATGALPTGHILLQNGCSMGTHLLRAAACLEWMPFTTHQLLVAQCRHLHRADGGIQAPVPAQPSTITVQHSSIG